MQRAKIIETNLNFGDLSARTYTNLIVIHHTGADIDASAKEIHRWHISAPNYYAGIGYHFVIRKDGTIERGRPVEAIGAHAYGFNAHSIGIQLSGDFDKTFPTMAQIEMTAMLIANLCADYRIPIDLIHICGHCDLMATDCPGKNLYAKIPIIVGKANWYFYSDRMR